MKSTLVILVFSIIISLVSSCYYDNEEELYPGTVCDTTNITYSNTIVAILSQNCYQCHSDNSTGVLLNNYTGLMSAVTDSSFWWSVSHNPAASPMPKGQPKLSECNLEKIRHWLDHGAPNN